MVRIVRKLKTKYANKIEKIFTVRSAIYNFDKNKEQPELRKQLQYCREFEL